MYRAGPLHESRHEGDVVNNDITSIVSLENNGAIFHLQVRFFALQRWNLEPREPEIGTWRTSDFLLFLTSRLLWKGCRAGGGALDTLCDERLITKKEREREGEGEGLNYNKYATRPWKRKASQQVNTHITEPSSKHEYKKKSISFARRINSP